MQPEAYCFVRDFAPEAERMLCPDRHYLLYASAGALRLRAGGRQWALPPARAALIAAGESIAVALPQRVTTCSVLFAPGFMAAPPAPLTVFEMSPLARELALACRDWGPDAGPLPAYARQIFAALAAVALRLAESPSPASMPDPASPVLARALALTAEAMAGTPSFAAIARGAGRSERALARLFAAETGLTWRACLRRMRMIRAIEALAGSEASVTEVALAVGYSSISAFNAAFRAFTGRTPSDYRASFR